tara:strand:- start:1775 stop:2425 length:651 start_codon:yes stop_codon:yes gene_type:complete
MPSEKDHKIKEIEKVLDILKQTKQKTMLEEFSHLQPFQLLIMTLLSARTKDATVIPITLRLFETHSTPKEILEIPEQELAKKIKKIGFHNTKAKHILQLCHKLITEFKGKVPDTLKELTSLPGVGRKTANCILSYVFNKPAIAVDIYVHRITNKQRLNWINTKTPEQSEIELQRIVPKDRWNDINAVIVDHGQRICEPIKPKCQECSVIKFCQYPK